MMTIQQLIKHRLSVQQLSRHDFKRPEEVVAWLGAVQAQDYSGGLWAVGQRIPGCTEADVEQALADKRIVRSWPMRGTLHFMAAADIRWMLELGTPRILKGAASRYRELELDAATFSKSRKVFTKALKGHNRLSRDEMYQLLEKSGISAAGQRGIHMLGHAAQIGLLCFGPRQGKQQTFVLLDEWLPDAKSLSRDKALAELARRYFQSHAPATAQDFAWWSGLTLTDVKKGMEQIADELSSEEVDGKLYWLAKHAGTIKVLPKNMLLLPNYDEYIVGYTDRSAIAAFSHQKFRVFQDNPVFRHTIVSGGQVIGNWRRTLQKDKVTMEILPFDPLNATQKPAVEKAVQAYGRFLGKEVKMG